MMDFTQFYRYYGFYQNELQQNILSFWMPRCEDKEYGGFVNCFDNTGEHLISYDKYTWSQGRFVWIFARMACTPAPIFSNAERTEFLRLAKQGADFLMKHCLIGVNDWRCTFLMNRDGSPKEVTPGDPLDMSVYADCLAVTGIAMYSYAAKDADSYQFAKDLYHSIIERVNTGNYHTLPYPLSEGYRAHGIPMILSNTTRELYRAAQELDRDYCAELLNALNGFASNILNDFTDADDCIHEVIRADKTMFPQILGQHINPGHILEDLWFELDAAQLLGKEDIWNEKLFRICKKALTIGWDEEFGGILHFAGMNGGEPIGDMAGIADEPMTKQLFGWSDKLWWIHSEALYTTMRCALASGDPEFLTWHEKVFDYTYRVFPNRNPEIREWIQIRTREGLPQNKVVALPVKDPFHIVRNLLLLIELLYDYLSEVI